MRTKQVAKSKRTAVVKAVQNFPEEIEVPAYSIGDIISKDNGKRFVIAYDEVKWAPGEKRYQVISLDTGELCPEIVKGNIMAIYGYKIRRAMPSEKLEALLGHRGGSTPKLRADHCNEGLPIPLDDCEMAKGCPNPLTEKVKIVGRNVMYQKGDVLKKVKAICPKCGRKVGVIINKMKKQFFIRRHKGEVGNE